jgi:hypothetical protein
MLAKRLKYVNIADLMSSSMPSNASKADPAQRPPRGEEPMYELIELFFFAYRDFVADADRLLEAYGFGRAHHRVLYFVTRRPGLTIAELLEILRITKQSLNRVLRFALALDQLGGWGLQSAKSFLTAMIDPQKPSSHSAARQEAAKQAGRTQ